MSKYGHRTGDWCEAIVNKLGGEEAADAFLRDELVISKRPADAILEFVGTANIAATTTKFVAKEKFKLKKDGGICSYIGDNFKDWFGGKEEDPLAETTLRYAKLRKSSVDTPIVAELGGEAKAETTLTEVFGLMSKQAKAETGVLLTNGWANIFYVRDQNGVLRAVFVHWDDGGWSVHAGELGYPDTWLDGYQVFSRN